MRLPGHTPDGKSAVVAIDTSGSMSSDDVRQCVSESAAVMRSCGCEKLWLILHDARVYFSGWVTEADLTKLKMARGGTSHTEVFAILNKEHANKAMNVPKEEEVTLAILFTDLGTDFPSRKPAFEVIWGVPANSSPGMSSPVPFGKKVEVELG
jgi:predicted metal-dependent peptidase